MKRALLLVLCGFLFLNLATIGKGRDVEPLDSNLIKVSKTLEGKDEGQLIQQAYVEAVLQCLGRIYLSPQLIMARSLLDKYIENYAAKFIHSHEVVARTYEGGNVKLTVNVFVNFGRLLDDLEEKRFLYKPDYKPRFLVFLEENLDGKKALYTDGYQSIVAVLVDNGLKLPEAAILYPPTNLDLSKDPETLGDAIITAHKTGAGLIITGTSNTELLQEKELYYDTYHFYKTTMKLRLIRVDTGEELFAIETYGLAGNIDGEDAIRFSIQRAAVKATDAIIAKYKQIWDKVFLHKVDFRLLITGIREEDVPVLEQNLIQSYPGTEVYMRSIYHQTASLNLVSKAERGEIIRALDKVSYPELKIVKQQDNIIEVQAEY